MDAWPAQRKRWTEQGSGEKNSSSSVHTDSQIKCTSVNTHTMIYTNVLHIRYFTEPGRNKKHIVLLFHYILILSDCFFTTSLQSVFILSASGYNLPCSPPFLPSVSPCVSLHHHCVFFSPRLSSFFILSPSLPLRLSPWGHRGQAGCRGLVDKYHVSLLHVFSGRTTVCLLPALYHRVALLSAVLKVYLHF